MTTHTDHSELATAPIGTITANLVETHHDYLRKLLPRLAFLVNKIRDVHGAHHPELQEVAETFQGYVQVIETHLDQAESALFPRCEELAAGSEETREALRAAIAAHEARHAEVTKAFQVMRSLTNGFEVPADSCNTYQMTFEKLVELEADTQQHLQKETALFARLK